ncbi:uncharacterized protein LOC129602865 [Paramacrobiotus metropolitanus]|uniref:uncharacterized protein LOC129602865 n=1 Tax=Paramacrobiotus metropolitanus TaxID=2943436 RepID=UPI002445AD6C|nr:uncharacterized protein LOC129602865 [Paramacrobiotus metropolitanus]
MPQKPQVSVIKPNGNSCESSPRVNSLHPGSTLTFGQILHSPGGSVELSIDKDGNLAVYRTIDRVQLWTSGTEGKFTPGIHAILFSNGNFVLRAESGHVWWHSGTRNLKDPWLTVQDTGFMVIHDGCDPVPKWTTETHNGIKTHMNKPV